MKLDEGLFTSYEKLFSITWKTNYTVLCKYRLFLTNMTILIIAIIFSLCKDRKLFKILILAHFLAWEKNTYKGDFNL